MKKEKFNKCIQRIISGDNSALKDIYDEYFTKIQYSAAQIINDYYEAQDIASDIMLYILQNADKIGEVESPDAWIRTVTKNNSVSFIRRDNKAVKTDRFIGPVSQEPDPQAVAYHELNECMQQLTQYERELVELHFIYGYKYKELSAKLNVPVGTIKRQIFDIKNKLTFFR